MSERERLLSHGLRCNEKKTLMEPPCDMDNLVCEQPMKAFDVFSQMGFDSFSILSEFVMASQERIRRKGILQDAKAIRLINCAYSKTECDFGQPLSRIMYIVPEEERVYLRSILRDLALTDDK